MNTNSVHPGVRGRGPFSRRRQWEGIPAARIPLVLVAGLVLSALPPVWAQTYAGQITSISTDKFLASTWWPVTVTAKNAGSNNFLTVRVSALPTGWELQAAEGDLPTAVEHYVGGGKSETYKFKVKSSPTVQSGTITWELWTVTWEQYAVQLAKKDQTVATAFAPAAFGVVYPAAGQTGVPILPTFAWQTAEGADTYHVELFEDQGGTASSTPFFQSTQIPATTLDYSTEQPLQYDTPYWWNVIAHNAFAQTVNTNGKSPFRTSAAPVPGDFGVFSPVADGKYSTLPQVRWSYSDQAVYYSIEVYDDVGGSPGPDPILTVARVDGFAWSFPPGSVPKGKRYWITVKAWASSTWIPPRKAYNCPLPFSYTDLSPFSQVSPANLLAEVELAPTFHWEPCVGAVGYRIEIRGAEELNRGYVFVATTSATSYPYAGPLLTPYAYYRWVVYALGAGEELAATASPYVFQTVDLQPFLLLEPGYGATGVVPDPLFTWMSPKGRHVSSTDFEIWRDHDTLPDQKVRVYLNSQSPIVTMHKFEPGLIQLERGRRYYWRVLAKTTDNKTRMNEMGFRPFWITDVGEFVLLSPSDLSTDVSYTPTFQWTAAANAERYSLALWLLDDQMQIISYPIVQVFNLPGTAYTHQGPPILTNKTPYAWQVFAWKGDGFYPPTTTAQPLRFTTADRVLWFGQGVKEQILGQGRLSGESAANGDALTGDGVLDIADVIQWIYYNQTHPQP